MKQCDFLIIGSGLAGLGCAVKLAHRNPSKKIIIVTKEEQSESNTKYAQGGVAVVWDMLNDSYKQHIEDTLRAGDGCCNPSVVEMVVKEGPERLKELIAWGAEFDRKKTGDFDLGLEGGHLSRRIIHHKDITGYEIEKTLLAKVASIPNIEVLSQHFTLDLITQHHLGLDRRPSEKICCYGAYIFDKNAQRVETYAAKITILATGGSGQVYRNTTNPHIATGDGVAMAYRAKAIVSGMEFIQFHPTALYEPDANQTFLISEAVRGFGALLKNRHGESFMHRYDQRRELASRDIVSRAIDSELKSSGEDCVYMDCRHLNREEFGEKFPNILRKCSEIGVDIRKDMIPVAPAAHYFCGGIEVDQRGRTSIVNLLACGECAHTGLHGANRLASNSLLEALVFAHRCSEQASFAADEDANFSRIPPEWNEEGTIQPIEHVLITHNRDELRVLMTHYVGIVRSYERLRRAEKRIKILYEETEDLYRRNKISPQLFELRNLVTVAYLIVQHSLARKENRGVFYNMDLVA